MNHLQVPSKTVFVASIMLLMVMLSLILSSCSNQEQSEAPLKPIIEQSFRHAALQYQHMITLLDSGRFPKTFENGIMGSSGSGWWCSGFYPGTLLYLFEATGDSSLLVQAQKSLNSLEREKHNKTTHDLGFMMYCSFGNAYRITGDETYKEIINESARSLITRFDSTVGCIRSWDPAPWNDKWEYPVIIDNMMNLEMLLWAGQEFNNEEFTDVAITHANTTLKNHFREDYSSYHVVSYDTITGEVEMKNTDQGHSDESSWARGQAWGLYGYITIYRFTKEQKYLAQAIGIADFILNHSNLPQNGIPYWDFNAPGIPDAKRDASAAAIMASALLELKEYADKEKGKQYFALAERMLTTLLLPEYFAETGTNGGFILKHSVGNMPDKSEVDVPLTYADYYFVEAMQRYLGN